MTLLLKLAKNLIIWLHAAAKQMGKCNLCLGWSGTPKSCGIYYYGRRERNVISYNAHLSHTSQLNCPVEEKLTLSV